MASASTSYRRALELSLKHVHPEGKGTLNQRIRALEKQNAVPESLIALMDGIRFLGNDGAHEEEDPTREDVEAGRDFTTLLLTYLFELRSRVADAAERRKNHP